MALEPELTCKELVELVTEYLENTLAPAERARFDTHLAVCPGCTSYLDQMRKTLQSLGSLSEETFPTAARDRLLDVFRQWKQRDVVE